MPTTILFVFYTLSMPQNWTYTKMPAGWEWIGGGSTSPLGRKKLAYEREEQFVGTTENKQKMKEYLVKYFDGLKRKKVVSRYKIRNTYLP